MARQAIRHSKAPTGTRLREAMAVAGVTTDELARELGVGARLVQKWRSGDTIPSYPNLVRLADRLDRTVAWFFAEDGDKEHVA